jgi:UDP-N-acetylmuramoylalanine--D-glutamate ligase
MNVKDAKIVVMGLARSGIGAARLLDAAGARVTVADRKSAAELSGALSELNQDRIRTALGSDSEAALEQADLIVISPGVPAGSEALNRARRRGIKIIGELELASRFLNAPILAVTGTNGKSTTVTLIGLFLKEAGKTAFVGGNLGTAVSEAALASYSSRQSAPADGGPDRLYEYLVIEVSSFQLETIETFHPWVASVLNVTLDHMDRYSSVEDYVSAKARIFENQGPMDYAVLNLDDERVARLRTGVAAKIIGFRRHASRGAVEAETYLEGDRIISTVTGKTEEVCRRSEIRLIGLHNVDNVMAAATYALLCGCPLEAIKRVLRSFPGLEHALEMVRERRGVRYVNDSKGTNVDATLKALEGIEQPIWLIAGGRDKGADFSRLKGMIRDRVKGLILIGEAASSIQAVVGHSERIRHAGSLREAVEVAAAEAQPGEVVLLSPACASFDMFADYQDRGRQFKSLVHGLPA